MKLHPTRAKRPQARFIASRWLRLGFSLAFALLLFGACSRRSKENEPKQTGRPHILLISIDTLRADHLGSYGYHRNTSPFLDGLGAKGLRFSNAFVNTHGTPPSHTTLFTSLYQENHRVSYDVGKGKKRNDRIPDSLVLLPEIFRDAGYATIGVTDGGYMSESFGFERGFDRFSDQSKGIQEGGELLLRQIEEALQNEDPIFAFLHTYEVHSPYESPAEFNKLFGDFPSDIDPVNEVLFPIQDDARSQLTEEDLDFLRVAYDRGIRFTDFSLRQLFSELEENGFLENAFIVITSDHGEEFGDHGGLLHRVSLYDELLRIPLILLGTGAPSGEVNSRMVSTLDMAPTMLVAAGISPPTWMQGRDLLSLPQGLFADGFETGSTARWLESPAENTEEIVFSQYAFLLYSVRTPRWKLIEDRRSKQLELYDLQVDPKEQNNLASSRPDIRTSLLSKIRSWRSAQESKPKPESVDPAISEELKQRLEALGYLD